MTNRRMDSFVQDLKYPSWLQIPTARTVSDSTRDRPSSIRFRTGRGSRSPSRRTGRRERDSSTAAHRRQAEAYRARPVAASGSWPTSQRTGSWSLPIWSSPSATTRSSTLPPSGSGRTRTSSFTLMSCGPTSTMALRRPARTQQTRPRLPGPSAPRPQIRRLKPRNGQNLCGVVLVVFVVCEPGGIVVRDHPQLGQAAHLELAHALAGQVHDHANLLQRDPRAVGHVQGAGLGELPQLLVGEVHLHRPGAGVHVDVEVVLAGDVGTGPFSLGTVAARLGTRGVQLGHEPLQLWIKSPGGGLLPEEPRHLLAAHGPRPLPRLVLRIFDDGENAALRLAHKSLTPSRALPVR